MTARYIFNWMILVNLYFIVTDYRASSQAIAWIISSFIVTFHWLFLNGWAAGPLCQITVYYSKLRRKWLSELRKLVTFLSLSPVTWQSVAQDLHRKVHLHCCLLSQIGAALITGNIVGPDSSVSNRHCFPLVCPTKPVLGSQSISQKVYPSSRHRMLEFTTW